MAGPADYNYEDKKIVIIGSGATAVTMLPAMVKNGAKKVIMLQRSPFYVVTIPAPDNKPNLLGSLLPIATLIWLRRISWLGTMWMIHFMCAHFPSTVCKGIAGDKRKQLPAKTPFETHFVSSYSPWEQLLCITKDGDFFRALHTDNTDVMTATIKTATASGIELNDGSILDADVIVTATGSNLCFGGHIPVYVDNEPVAWRTKLLLNGSMVQDVPNLFFMWGYTNAGWTLGVDSTVTSMCRLFKYMEKQGACVALPRTPPGSKPETQIIWKLSSTYRLAAEPYLPKYAFYRGHDTRAMGKCDKGTRVPLIS